MENTVKENKKIEVSTRSGLGIVEYHIIVPTRRRWDMELRLQNAVAMIRTMSSQDSVELRMVVSDLMNVLGLTLADLNSSTPEECQLDHELDNLCKKEAN